MAMVWSKNFSVGVEEIDQQHKELFNRTNKLLEASQAGKGKEVIKETMSFLENYVQSHFYFEESLMRKYQYPEFSTHKKLHENFNQNFLQLKKEAEENIGVYLITRVNKTVVDWWTNHILHIDKKLGAFLQEKMQSK
ncbi:MAG: bacteriohemerythrin [Candidatus Caldatribacteriaceae bacterium]